MSKVDFYIVSDDSESALMRVGCRVVDKAWQQGHRIYVLTDSAQRSADMDDALWTFRQDSFVPHARWHGDSAPDAPILIGEHDSLPEHTAVLVNLSGRTANCAAGCERIAEIVAADETARAAARERYRSYREHGATLDTHEVQVRSRS